MLGLDNISNPISRVNFRYVVGAECRLQNGYATWNSQGGVNVALGYFGIITEVEQEDYSGDNYTFVRVTWKPLRTLYGGSVDETPVTGVYIIYNGLYVAMAQTGHKNPSLGYVSGGLNLPTAWPSNTSVSIIQSRIGKLRKFLMEAEQRSSQYGVDVDNYDVRDTTNTSLSSVNASIATAQADIVAAQAGGGSWADVDTAIRAAQGHYRDILLALAELGQELYTPGVGDVDDYKDNYQVTLKKAQAQLAALQAQVTEAEHEEDEQTKWKTEAESIETGLSGISTTLSDLLTEVQS